jgi:GntR family transcriptional regulator, histidine utilization repressor
LAPTDRPVPAGLQSEIRAYVLQKLASGEWAPGERIPSETELTARFGASRMTVHHALKALSAEGWLRRVKGLGTFVAPPRGHVLHARLLDIRDEITGRGRVHSLQLLSRALRGASLQEAALFAVEPGAPLLHAVALHREDGRPVQIEDRLVDPARVPGVAELDPAQESYFSFLMRRFPYPEGQAAIRAVQPSAELAAALELKPGEPCLEVERVTRAHGAVLTVARLTYPASRCIVSGEIAPPGGWAHRALGGDA